MRGIEKKVILITVLMILSVMIIGSAFADPLGTGTLSPTGSENGTADTAAGQITAVGGNVTNVDINSASITGKWAGIYGAVTGSISLENAAGAVFYNWTMATPSGEIYATRESSTPSWGGIACASGANVLAESSALSLGSGADNMTNTFCESCGNFSTFSVGTTPITADTCTYRTNAFAENGAQTTSWDQILLYEGSHIVYTTIIDQDTTGFDGSSYDFQLLVGENSTAGTVTTYYIYVEIE
jgi:hypothetical protein